MSSKKSKKGSIISRAEKATQAIIDEQVEQMNEAIQQVEVALRPYEKLREKQQNLIRARDALLGGNKLTGGGGTRVRLETVKEFVRENPGASTQTVADGVGGTYAGAYAHLNRNEGDLFLTDHRGNWWLRSPKDGKNTIEDYEEDE